MSLPEELNVRLLRRVADMHAVYRMFDASGRLLYVGITGNVSTRFASHAEKRWFLLVDMIKLEWFPTQAAALLAERRAIQSERPRFNVAGKKAPRLKPVPKPPPKPPKAQEEWSTGPCTLSYAVRARVLNGTQAAARQWRHRDPAFPKPVGKNGPALLYDAAELAAWDQARRS